MSVAQIAIASMRTSTSARFGTGTSFSISLSSPGLPSTQAFCLSGTGRSLPVFTPGGAYIAASLVRRGLLRALVTELGRERAGCGSDFAAHQRQVIFARPHRRRGSADRPDHRARMIADRRADADHAGQIFFAVERIA